MRSSEWLISARIFGVWWLCTACSLAGCAPRLAPGAPSFACVGPSSAAVMELRKAIEAAPLYSALASTAPVRTCRVAEQAGKVVVDYTFDAGGQLHVERDAAIEFMLQEARFALPVALAGREILMRAERAAFGAEGCDIEWRSQTQPSKEDPALRETVYRGKTCNCQARVRTDASERVVALTFRTAC